LWLAAADNSGSKGDLPAQCRERHGAAQPLGKWERLAEDWKDVPSNRQTAMVSKRDKPARSSTATVACCIWVGNRPKPH
jgi:hypothetical protein